MIVRFRLLRGIYNDGGGEGLINDEKGGSALREMAMGFFIFYQQNLKNFKMR